MRALTEGLFQGPQRSSELRERLESIAERKGREHLHRLLVRLDPAAAARIAPRDKPKIIRALEVRLETGRPLSAHLETAPRDPLTGYVWNFLGLDPPREECYQRIDLRVRRMFDAGLVGEVRGLLARGAPREAKPFTAIGYRQVLATLDREGSWDEVIALIQRDTRRYAKRQLTWFRNQHEAHWLEGVGDDPAIQRSALEWWAPRSVSTANCNPQ